MSTNTRKCPVCLCIDSFKKLIDFGEVPVSDQYLKSPEEKPGKIILSFEYCNNCAFIRQKKVHLYNYQEDTRKTGHTLMNYCYDVVEYLKENNGLIIDIGCNDGTFLDLLKKTGLENLLGIEPSISCTALCNSKGYRVENVYFNREESQRTKEKYGEASTIVCRHVLEHVESPFDFLLAAKNLLKDKGKLFVEVPDSNNIIEGLNVHELLDQHLSYFTPLNLEYIVNRAGFRTEKISVQPSMGGEAILLFASKENQADVKKYAFAPEKCENFSFKWERISQRLIERVKNLEKPLNALGASHPQSRFLIFSRIGEYVNMLIDDDPYKINKYLCVPNPVKIISTEQFIANPKGSVLHTAFGYDSWADKLQKQGITVLKFKRKLIEEINP